MLRQEQLLKSQSMQSATLDGGARYFPLLAIYYMMCLNGGCYAFNRYCGPLLGISFSC